MTNLITEARELCKKYLKSGWNIPIAFIDKTLELCDALEKAEERGQGCEHCQGWDTRSGAQYCPMCGKRLPVYAGTIGGEIVKNAMREVVE